MEEFTAPVSDPEPQSAAPVGGRRGTRRWWFVRGLYALAAISVLLAINAAIEHLPRSEYIEQVVLTCGIYVILAVSLNVVNGFTGQFSLGHAGFLGIGAYVGAALTVYGQPTLFAHIFRPDGSIPPLLGGLVLFLAMIAGGTVAAFAGLVVGLPSLKLRGDYLAIVTLGFNQIIYVVLTNLDVVGASRGFQSATVRGNTYFIPSLASFFWVYLVVAIVVTLCLNLRKSVHGLAFVSIREDEIAAEAMGIPTTRYKVIAFVFGAFFAGVAGVLYAHTYQLIKPDNFNFIISINIVVMVVLGGLGSVSGTAIGAILLTALPELFRGIDEYRPVIYAALLIVLMLARPQGIFGHRELDREWLRDELAALRTLPQRASDMLKRLKRSPASRNA